MDSHDFDALVLQFQHRYRTPIWKSSKLGPNKTRLSNSWMQRGWPIAAAFTGIPAANRRPMCLVRIAITFGP